MEYEVSGVDDAELSVFVNRRISYNDVAENSNRGVRGLSLIHI